MSCMMCFDQKLAFSKAMHCRGCGMFWYIENPLVLRLILKWKSYLWKHWKKYLNVLIHWTTSKTVLKPVQNGIRSSEESFKIKVVIWVWIKITIIISRFFTIIQFQQKFWLQQEQITPSKKLELMLKSLTWLIIQLKLWYWRILEETGLMQLDVLFMISLLS